MDLDVDRFADSSWAKQWTALTGIAPITKLPFSSYHDFPTLRAYLRGLEIEQAMADYHALSMLRLRSSSCRGIIYWSLNKGGPLFPFGCVDYGGRPMMSYYVIKRLFDEICIGAYRDIDDVQIVASNASGRTVEAHVRVSATGPDGGSTVLDSRGASLPPGQITRLATLAGYYQQVRDRTSEMVHAELVVDGQVISADTLLFCPLSEVRAEGEVKVTAVQRIEGAPDTRGAWSVEIESTGPVKMAVLEASRSVLFTDNYFPMAPGTRRQVVVTLLEPTDDEPVSLVIGSLDTDFEHSVLLT
jgi:beta-mannosidase